METIDDIRENLIQKIINFRPKTGREGYENMGLQELIGALVGKCWQTGHSSGYETGYADARRDYKFANEDGNSARK